MPYGDGALTDSVPCFPLSEPQQKTRQQRGVTKETHQRRTDGIRHLADQHQMSGLRMINQEHLLEERQQVSEPHAGAEVVEDVAGGIAEDGQPVCVRQLSRLNACSYRWHGANNGGSLSLRRPETGNWGRRF